MPNKALQLVVVTTVCLAALCPAARAQQELVQRVEDDIRTGASPVHDFGHFLKPGGVVELKQKADQLKGDLKTDFVTVPRDTANPGALAESVYRDLGKGPKDLIVVYDGKSVYGKTLALQGDREAFSRAADEAHAGFRLYAAKGLVYFADSIHRKVIATRQATVAREQAATQRVQLISGISIFIVVAALLALVVSRMRRRMAVRRLYESKLQHASKLFERIALALPDSASKAIRNRFLRLDKDLDRCRKGANIGDVERLIADCQSLEKDLRGATSGGVTVKAAPEAEVEMKQGV